MTTVPPINRPAPEHMAAWEDWSEKEILVALLIRQNAMAGMLAQMAQEIPQVMKLPVMKMAMKMFIKSDKSSEG